MAKFIVMVVAGMLANGCITTKDMRDRWAYVCPDGYRFDVRFSNDGDTAEFRDADGERRLKRAPSGSGARYTGDNLELWTKGAGATVRVDDRLAHADCQAEKQ